MVNDNVSNGTHVVAGLQAFLDELPVFREEDAAVPDSIATLRHQICSFLLHNIPRCPRCGRVNAKLLL
jgi:hypothetical protein